MFITHTVFPPPAEGTPQAWSDGFDVEVSAENTSTYTLPEWLIKNGHVDRAGRYVVLYDGSVFTFEVVEVTHPRFKVLRDEDKAPV